MWQAGKDGTPMQVTNEQLITNLRDITNKAKYNPLPQLQFQPEAEASYDLSARVLRWIKATNVTTFGFVGNEQYMQFERAKGTPPPGKGG